MHSFSSSKGKGDEVFKEKIGEILVAQGKTTEEQVDEALAIQRTDPRSIGKILVSLGYISEDDLAQALSMRLNVEYVALFEVQVDPEVLGIIEEDVLLQHKAVPLRIEDGRLIVAMTDPNDIYARSDLTISAGYPVTAVVAAEDAVRRLQDQLFGNGAVVDGALAELADAVQAYRATEDGDAEASRGDRRVDPGAQPEMDLGEPMLETNGAREEPAARRGGRRAARGARKVGEILVSQGKLTEDRLDQALELQKNDPRDLGKILVSLGFVTPVDLGRALAERLKLDFVVVAELSEDEVDPAAIELINEEALRKYMALPLRIEGGRLLVAMSDPNDIFALEDLRIIAKRPIIPVVATEEDLKGASPPSSATRSSTRTPPRSPGASPRRPFHRSKSPTPRLPTRSRRTGPRTASWSAPTARRRRLRTGEHPRSSRPIATAGAVLWSASRGRETERSPSVAVGSGTSCSLWAGLPRSSSMRPSSCRKTTRAR